MSAFSTVGATVWEKRACDELNAAGARLPRSASKVPLTPQEDRIAQLVIQRVEAVSFTVVDRAPRLMRLGMTPSSEFRRP